MSLLNKHGFTAREMEYLTPVDKKLNRMRFWSALSANTRKVCCAILVAVALLALFIRWTNEHTNRAEAAYNKYEQCVQDTYGVSATKFYQMYGEPANCK